MDRTSGYGPENVGSNPMVGVLIKYGPEEKLADSPACHAGDSGGSTRRARLLGKTPNGNIIGM